jgi:hypothetical protein
MTESKQKNRDRQRRDNTRPPADSATERSFEHRIKSFYYRVTEKTIKCFDFLRASVTLW